MIRCYLDGREVDTPPIGLDGLTFKKERHLRYWGFLYKSYGFVQGVNSLTFTDPWAVDALNHQYDRLGVTAQTRFTLTDDALGPNEQVYEGYIDYTKKRSRPGEFSVSLRDMEGVAAFETMAQTKFTVKPQALIQLKARRLDGAAVLTIDTESSLVRVARKEGRQIRHTIPLKKTQASGAANTSSTEHPLPGNVPEFVSALIPTGTGALAPIYTNTTSQVRRVRVSGQVGATIQANNSGVVRLTLAGGDRSVLVGEFGITSAPGRLSAVIDCLVSVGIGDSLSLNVTTNFDVTEYVFNYAEGGFVTINIEEDVPDSTAQGLTAGHAMAQLVQQASGKALKLRSSLLDQNDVFLTNGAFLRGVSVDPSLSVSELFDALNGPLNLMLSVDTDTMSVVVGQKKDLRRTGKVTYLLSITDITAIPNESLLFSEVLAGYKTSQGQSLLSALEVNSSRSYTTDITTLRATFDMRSEFIASSVLIEEQRRKKFDSATAGSSKADGLDANLFLIACQPTAVGGVYAAERQERVTRQEGISEPDTIYNVRFTPRRCLERWRDYLGGCGVLALQQSDTRQTVRTAYESGEYLDESQARVFADRRRVVPDAWLIDAPMSLAEYTQLGDWIVLPDGREGLLMEATWTQGLNGDSAVLSVWPGVE